MNNQPRFNYIITIHNKQDLIREVLTAILMCCRDGSHIYPVLDGCTDRTEVIIDQVIAQFSHIPITKVYTADVHEIRSINAGLKAANQDGDGYNIVLQDDVILADFLWESKICQLYEWGGEKLGFVSFRLGANLSRDANNSINTVGVEDHIENAYGHGLEQASVLLPGQIAYRDIATKSPVCIPFKLVRELGLLDERLAPYMSDDVEYSLRCCQAGYQNAVFGLRFRSDVEWGGTRSNPHSELGKLEQRNLQFIREWHQATIAALIAQPPAVDIIDVPHLTSAVEQEQASIAWQRNRAALNDFIAVQNQSTLTDKVKRLVQKTAIPLGWKS
jgi:hypothetical protein